MRRLINSAVLFGSAGLAANLNAQVKDSARTLTPVTVTAHRAPTAAGGAGSLSARIDSLPTMPAPTLDAALRRVPFVFVRANSRGEAELSVRGSESRTPTVLVDGLPVTIGWDSRTDASLIPLSGASTLRITRGMGSVLAGPNAVGSVIEIDGARSAIAGRTLSLATGIDQLGSSVVSGYYAAPIVSGNNNLGVRIGGAYRNRPALVLSGDLEDPGAPEGERINSDSKQHDFFGHLRFAARSGAYLAGGLTAYGAERGVQPEMHLDEGEQRLWRYPAQKRTFGTVGAGTGVRTTPWGQFTLDASFGVNSGKTEIEAFTDRTFQTLDGLEKGDERTLVTRVIAAHSFGGAIVRVGGTRASVRYLETFDDDPAARYTQNLSTFGAETDIPFGSRFAISAGLGIDNAKNPETGGRSTSDDAKADWAGRLGLTANVSSMLRLHAAGSQRSRFPALRELYSGSLGRFTPNPDLRPERLTVLEGGATITTGGFEVQGIVFRQINEDGVIRVTLDNNQFMRLNRDEIRSTGLEALAVWTRGSVSVIGDLLVQKVRVHDITAGEEARRPENVPELRATLGTMMPTVAKINANAWLTHSGTQYCSSGESEVKGKTRLDIGADREWSIGRGVLQMVKLLVSIDNVADAAVFDACGLPQPGRTLRAGLSLR
jgi:iron complex outermembrane receptor protein